MTERPTLHGYPYSVYTWIARLTLTEKGVAFRTEAVDPFGDLPDGYDALHPFHRVPVLTHAGTSIYETAAITRYLDRAFPDPSLTPRAARAAARMDQVIAVIDSYGYWPLIRQVFAHAVFRPREGLAGDPAIIAEGLAASRPVLRALDQIAGEGLVLTGETRTLADCHLAPMLAYFTMAEEGAAALVDAPALARWWQQTEDWPALSGSVPPL